MRRKSINVDTTISTMFRFFASRRRFRSALARAEKSFISRQSLQSLQSSLVSANTPSAHSCLDANPANEVPCNLAGFVDINIINNKHTVIAATKL
jgi:hypothetical protein